MVTKTTRQLARRKVLNARQRGELVPPETCPECGDRPEDAHLMEAHHEDYAIPLDVVWVCLLCHRKLHAKERRALAHQPYKEKVRNYEAR